MLTVEPSTTSITTGHEGRFAFAIAQKTVDVGGDSYRQFYEVQ